MRPSCQTPSSLSDPMNIFKLLMTGKSLFGFVRRPRRYEILTENLLPKFGPIEKPDSASDARQESSTKTGSLFDREPDWKSKNQKHPIMSNSLINPMNVEGGSLTNAQHAGNDNLTCGQADRSRSRFGLFSFFATQNVAKASRRLVQGELSLDSVRVVRNDLSDSDVELVRVRRPSQLGQTNSVGPEAVQA